MKTRFRIKVGDTIKAQLFTANGNTLLTTIYDSGYSRISQVYSALLQKCSNPPKGAKYSVYVEDNNTYWSNR